jgi:hypothetical protein
VQSHSHSRSDHSAFHRALIAFVCVAMALLSGSSPAPLAGADWLTRQIHDRVEQVQAPNHTAVPTVRLDIGVAEELLDESVELAEPADDDETKHYLLPLDAVSAFLSQTGLYESSADRALTPFRLRAFSSRGSPSV